MPSLITVVVPIAKRFWSSYIMLESASADAVALEKRVFLREITKLPWSKSFAVLGLEMLSSILSKGELTKVWQTLEQREIRIHSNVLDSEG